MVEISEDQLAIARLIAFIEQFDPLDGMASMHRLGEERFDKREIRATKQLAGGRKATMEVHKFEGRTVRFFSGPGGRYVLVD